MLFLTFCVFFVPLRMLAVVFCLRLSCFVCVSVACADQQRTGGGSSEVPPALRAGCKRHHCMIPADVSHVSVFSWSLQILSPPCSNFQESGARKLNMTSKSHLHLHQTVWAKKQKTTLGITTKTCIATGTCLSKWNLLTLTYKFTYTCIRLCEQKKNNNRKWHLAKSPKLASDCLSKDTGNDTWQSHLHLHQMDCTSKETENNLWQSPTLAPGCSMQSLCCLVG